MDPKHINTHVKKRRIFKTAIISVFLICLLIFGMMYSKKLNESQSLLLLKQAAQRSAVQCYANEGAYPSDISYLEEEYGLRYDHDKYFIFYDTFASNMMPTIEVYEKK